jgi:hypothetical protein
MKAFSGKKVPLPLRHTLTALMRMQERLLSPAAMQMNTVSVHNNPIITGGSAKNNPGSGSIV